MHPIYLDNAATTPLAPQVREAMVASLEGDFGNPSSRHPVGVRAAEALDRARRKVARALGVRSEQVVLTSGGTEANNLAVLGIARAARRVGKHVVVGPTEHDSVREAAAALGREGFEVETARLSGDGSLDQGDLAARLRADTVVVCQMLASNELGSVYPVRRVSALVRSRSPRARLVVDAVQAFGKLDCSPLELGADALTVSAHKVHGPKGAGALVLAEEVSLEPLLFGGGQERGLRSGTENVAAMVGFGVAAELAEGSRASAVRSMAEVRSLLASRLAELSGARILEPGAAVAEPLPSILSVLLPGAPADVRMNHLEARGVLASSGSACHAARREPSPALVALGLSADEARCVLRLSFSRETTLEEAERAAVVFAEVQRELQGALR